MPKPHECPSQGVYDAGHSRVQAWGPDEQTAWNAMQAQLPNALAIALDQQAAALKNALRTGDAACKSGNVPCKNCEAWFRAPDLGAPWTAVGSVAPYTKWLARGGYSWTIEVKCECECAVSVIAEGSGAKGKLFDLRHFRSEEMSKSAAGRRYMQVFEDHNDEVTRLLGSHPTLATRAQAILVKLLEYLPWEPEQAGKPVDSELIGEVDALLHDASPQASPQLVEAIRRLQADLVYFRGVSIAEGLAKASA